MEDKNIVTEKPKRKTHTSTEVKRRYNSKMYSRVFADLPKEFVAKFKETAKNNGASTASILKQAMERYIEENAPE